MRFWTRRTGFDCAVLLVVSACLGATARGASPEAKRFPPDAADTNLTHLALAAAERAALGTDPAELIRGAGVWRNAGVEEESERVHRAPVNAAYPSWFILAWAGPQRVTAVRLRGNLEEFRLSTLADSTGLNPAVAPESAWRRLATRELRRLPGQARDEVVYELVCEQPIETRALRLLIREVRPRNHPIAWLGEFSAWGKALSGPPEALNPQPPCTVETRVPVTGEAALVIDDAQGRRVRNLFAQVERTAGARSEPWNLKDGDGQYVAAGTYCWKLIAGPTPELRYQMTPYPNVELHSPDSTPWNNTPQDGWLANHGNQSAVCAVGQEVYMGAGGTEGGHALIACDLNGRKLWGSPQGVDQLFTDGPTLFFRSASSVHRFDAAARRATPLLSVAPAPERGGALVGLAARENRIYAAHYSPLPYLANATAEGNVDLDACLPRLPESIKRSDNYGIPVSPRRDFLSYFRLKDGFVGGDARNTLALDSTRGTGAAQHILLAFRRPTALGSLVFPRPQTTDSTFRLSVLKPDAPYPPRVRHEADWTEVEVGELGPWNCVAVPAGTRTRALRIAFTRAGADLMGEGGAGDAAGAPDLGGDLVGGTAAADDALAESEAWGGRVEGMRLLRCRFRNLLPLARIEVSSGTYRAETGEWDAQRREPLSPEEPGALMFTWEQPQAVRGLAVKEIDGASTLIDVFTGTGDPALAGMEGWEQMAEYRQPRRNHYQPDGGNNADARYLDGVVDFGRSVTTRAVRLRVVRQWGEQSGRPEGVRRDRGGTVVDPCRCRIYGAAPLEYLGGEDPLDPIVTQRLTVFDAADGRKLREQVSPVTGAIAFRPTDGALFGRIGPRVVQLDPQTLQPTDFVTDLLRPVGQTMAFDPQGRLYVYDHADTRRNIRVYGPDGRFLHAIGKPGRRPAGPYDAELLDEVCALSADGAGNLWVVYPHDNPRRIARFRQDGTFMEDYFGNTNYGGGGVLDPEDPTRFYWGDLRFAIDWQTGRTSLDSLLSTHPTEASVWGLGFRSAAEAIVVKDRRYFVSAPLSHGAFTGLAVVGLYDEHARCMRLCAAMGGAGAFPYLQRPEFIKAVGGRPLGAFRFIWTDRNADGEVQVKEVDFTALPGGRNPRHQIGRFDHELGAWSRSWDDGGAHEWLRYEVQALLADGTPVFKAKVMPFWADYRLPDNTHFRFGPRGNEGLSPTGELRWSYRAGYGMDGLKVYPWAPGVVDLQFGVSGMATVDQGELGTIFVIHANNGQMNLWTSDGLLAGHLTYHARDPRAKSWPAVHARNTHLENLTLGQEHFRHFFCRASTGRYYMVAGHTHASIVEVTGLEKFRRASGEITVTPEMLARTREWEARYQRRQLLVNPKLVVCAERQPLIDGAIGDGEWSPGSTLGGFAEFWTAYDRNHLYLAWRVTGRGPLANSGEDFRRAFKTGAAVDVQISTDPAADPARRQPGAGDLRLLITQVKGKPVVVLYRPEAPGAPAAHRWETSTPGGGTTVFEQVVTLPEARVAIGESTDGYCVEAAIPLAALGLKPPTDGLTLPLDWGVLTTDAGHITRTRQYWANAMATGVADEPTEARLEPALWGHVRFQADRTTDMSLRLDAPGGAAGGNEAVDEFLEDLK